MITSPVQAAAPLPEGWFVNNRHGGDFGDAPDGTRCFKGSDIDPERYTDGQYVLIAPFNGEYLEWVDGRIHIVGTVYGRLEKDPKHPMWGLGAAEARRSAALPEGIDSELYEDALLKAVEDYLCATGRFATSLALIRHGHLEYLDRLRTSYADDPECEPMFYGVLWPSRLLPPETAALITPETAEYVAASAEALARERGDAGLIAAALRTWRQDAREYAEHVAEEIAADKEQARLFRERESQGQPIAMAA